MIKSKNYCIDSFKILSIVAKRDFVVRSTIAIFPHSGQKSTPQSHKIPYTRVYLDLTFDFDSLKIMATFLNYKSSLEKINVKELEN